MKISTPSIKRGSGMTMLELLVVVAIIGLLAALLIPNMGKMQEIAVAAKDTNHLTQIAVATTVWSTENGGRLPSPEYPGGIEVPTGVDEDDYFPKHWNYAGTGKWLDGVVFGMIYLSGDGEDGEDSEEAASDDAQYGGGGSNGEHLKGTIFESAQSFKKNPLESDWHKHSYAMNANLQHDRIYNDASDAHLTEKTLSNLNFAPNAMLYIDCSEPNIVLHGDRSAIIDTIEQRWGKGGQAIVAYLDGHSDRLRAADIPDGDPETDRESSRFWRGVDAD